MPEDGQSLGGMQNKGMARHRQVGLIFLGLAAGQLILGQTLLDRALGRGFLFVIYWLVCILWTLLAILIALFDLWLIRLRARASQEALLERAVKERERSDRDGDS